jgi:hypothetical protein
MQDWIERYATALGVAAPSADDVDDLLALAATAAHASERPAAPLSCWLAGKSGLTPTEALTTARSLAESFGAD